MEIDNVDVQEFFEHLYIHQPKEEKKNFSKTFPYEISLATKLFLIFTCFSQFFIFLFNACT
jgi:hypothetical protein